MDAILLNWGVKALRVPVPKGDPWVTSCTTDLNVPRNCRKGLKLTGRVSVDHLLEFINTHLCEIAIVDVPLELRIGPSR